MDTQCYYTQVSVKISTFFECSNSYLEAAKIELTHEKNISVKIEWKYLFYQFRLYISMQKNKKIFTGELNSQRS